MVPADISFAFQRIQYPATSAYKMPFPLYQAVSEKPLTTRWANIQCNSQPSALHTYCIYAKREFLEHHVLEFKVLPVLWQ